MFKPSSLSDVERKFTPGLYVSMCLISKKVIDLVKKHLGLESVSFDGSKTNLYFAFQVNKNITFQSNGYMNVKLTPF